jgi:hypothetical protein
MQLEFAETFVKTLSANDVGATGGHQAGILIPKLDKILAFFPTLSVDDVNPRKVVTFRDTSTGEIWQFNYIYYNGALTGDSTRNEYRLTGMTDFLRSHSAAVGDGIEISKSVTGERYITHHPQAPVGSQSTSDPDVITLSGTWKIRRARSL